MILPSSKVLDYIHPDATSTQLCSHNGQPCREITIEELKALIAAEHVVAVVRGRKLRRVELTVPADVAFRVLGESKAKVKDQLHTDASITVQRSLPTLPSFHKRHHAAHCHAWNKYREPLPVGKTVTTAIRFAPPKGVGRQREQHLRRIADEVVAAYQDPAVHVRDIYKRFGISWDELAWLLLSCGVDLRAEHHDRPPQPMVPRLRRFLPYADEERIELYRRAWGPGWPSNPIPRYC